VGLYEGWESDRSPQDGDRHSSRDEPTSLSRRYRPASEGQMSTKTSKGRHAGRLFAAAPLVVLVLAGCGDSGQVKAGDSPADAASTPAVSITAASTPDASAESTPASATPTAAAQGGRDLSKIDPCKLATPAEATAALGAPFKKTLRSPSRPNVIACNFGLPPYEPSLHVSVVHTTELFKSMYAVGKRGGRPIPGLGDDAFATRDGPLALVDAEVKVLAGDLIVGVALVHRPGSKPGDRTAAEARLAKLAGIVLARVQP
jgi:hypothetical protein